MFLSQELSLDIVRRDLDPDFIQSFAVGLGWGYNDLFRGLRESVSLTDDVRKELFNRGRNDIATRVLADAAKQHGIPLEFLRLECNGQMKAVAKCGRLILILEAVSHLEEHPRVADYKVSLSDMHAYMRQLELDLGDRPRRIRDWSGNALGVLLHGSKGPNFSESDRGLGILTLGLPDAAYGQWVSRIDLIRTAVYGEGFKTTADGERNRDAQTSQTDNVVVKPKRKNNREGVA